MIGRRQLAMLGLLLVVSIPAFAQERPTSAEADSTDGAMSIADRVAAAGTVEAEADTVLTLEQRLLQIDDILAAEGDSLVAAGVGEAIIEDHLRLRREKLVRDAQATVAATTGSVGPVFHTCENSPEAGIKADVTKVNYFGRWTNSVKVRGGGTINNKFGIVWDAYRKQDKTVETRNLGLDYSSGSLLPVILTASASIDWSETITTNSGGSTNTDARKVRRAGVRGSRSALMVGPVSNNVTAGVYYNDQKAVNLNQRNDFSVGEISGAIRSGVPLAEGVNLATRIYGIGRDGESLLAGSESPTSTLGDSLGAGAYYNRGLAKGAISVTQSNFDRRYLAYRTNSNGQVDTLNLPPGSSTVVNELEEKDALNLRWDNTFNFGRFEIFSRLSHMTQRQQYRESGVGARDYRDDKAEFRFTVPVGADSFAVVYKYAWGWDNQQIKDATAPRGRQNNKLRDFSFDWFRDLFANTKLSVRYRVELTQAIAEWVNDEPFNENDRDRYTEEGRLKIDSSLSRSFNVGLLLEFQSIDDILIRTSRSANTNEKQTYTVSPNYRWAIGPRLTLQQTFRMYIQYVNYEFGELDYVNKDDSYNKRGSLGTKLSWEPSERLSVEVKHDYNQRFNGTRTSRDAAGNFYYTRDANQYINRAEVGMVWDATDWLELATATYHSKDQVQRFGSTDIINDRYSGELWVGGIVNETWGKSNNLKLKASIKRYLAYGPNVTETSADYWKADVLVSWAF